MYPSIKFHMVKKAIDHYSTNLSTDEKALIQRCLSMIEFGMGNTFFSFRDQHYQYNGHGDADNKGLTIGGFESAWLADLVASWLLETCANHFEHCIFDGIYRDDGFIVFKGKRSAHRMGNWLKHFQTSVNNTVGSDNLRFSMVVWSPEKPQRSSSKWVTVVHADRIHFLDLDLLWNEDGTKLLSKIGLKPNQRLIYLNSASTHSPSVFRAVQTGVCDRLATHTSVTPSNMNKRLDEIYPDHAAALRAAGNAPEEFPTLSEAIETVEQRPQKQKKRNGFRKGEVFVCIGRSNIWSKPLSCILQKLRNALGLKWLRLSMSYHKFPNFRSRLQSDLRTKVMAHIESKDFQDLECNCSQLGDGACAFKGKCRKSMVVYQLTHRATGNTYIGCTQRKWKTRTQEHTTSVRSLFKSRRRSTTFAHHYVEHLRKTGVTECCPGPPEIRASLDMEILWQGTALKCMRSFGRLNCQLCMEEKMRILSASRNPSIKLINSRSEIHEPCRHKASFHRLRCSSTPVPQGTRTTFSTSADDPVKGEKTRSTHRGPGP